MLIFFKFGEYVNKNEIFVKVGVSNIWLFFNKIVFSWFFGL